MKALQFWWHIKVSARLQGLFHVCTVVISYKGSVTKVHKINLVNMCAKWSAANLHLNHNRVHKAVGRIMQVEPAGEKLMCIIPCYTVWSSVCVECIPILFLYILQLLSQFTYIYMQRGYNWYVLHHNNVPWAYSAYFNLIIIHSDGGVIDQSLLKWNAAQNKASINLCFT